MSAITTTLRALKCSDQASLFLVRGASLCSVWVGAALFGELESSGIGEPFDMVEVPNVDNLTQGCSDDNLELLSSLREDTEGPTLFQQAFDEAELGRMEEPVAGAGWI